MRRLLLLAFIIPACCIAQPRWQAFNSQVFAKAQAEHKFVLLHLRANWCHWCHVMEAQTYANLSLADSINLYFIPCMEDHDARPDLTARYKDYGWPATIVFDEKGNELYKEAGYITVDEFNELIAGLKAGTISIGKNIMPQAPANNAAALKRLDSLFYASLDMETGGFVFGQKYIDFETFEYALTHYKQDARLKQWLKRSIDNSAGLYDKAWGGIYQYSTHNDWKHPHYEKLLSIQARYIKLYCWYFRTFNDSTALKKATGIGNYVQRFLLKKDGLYANAQDADLVQGQKAHAYFALPDKQRLQQGIPAIDSNAYTTENAQLAEAYVYLWANTGNDTYLRQSQHIADQLFEKRRNGDGLMMHGEAYNATVSLSDNLAMCKALQMLFRATGNAAYKENLHRLAAGTLAHFYKQGAFISYTGSSALPAAPIIAENIEAARLFNLLGHACSDSSLGRHSKALMQFLLSNETMREISTEPGIMSAAQEIGKEPMSGLYLLYGKAAQKDLLMELAGIPVFYLNSGVYDARTIPASKQYLYDSFDENAVLFCTSSYCSAPMHTSTELRKFMKR